MPVLSHGAGGERTDVVCGYMHSEDPPFDPNFGAFPPALAVRVPEGPVARWVESSIEYALSVTDPSVLEQPMSTRLPELLLIEVQRMLLAEAPVAEHGWVAALRDPVLAPALARRLRLGGGIQPGVQARSRVRTRIVAGSGRQPIPVA